MYIIRKIYKLYIGNTVANKNIREVIDISNAWQYNSCKCNYWRYK